MKVEKFIEKFKDIRVAVIGDLILDEYLFGEVERISPEAPVPVAAIKERKINPGGAANVALNLRALGSDVDLFGIVGRDTPGGELLQLLSERGIGIEGIIEVPDRPTTLKTRVISQGQQMIRLDREVTSPIDDELANKILRRVREGLDDIDAVIFQDYNKGLLTAYLITRSIELFGERLKAVDPKLDNFFTYKGVDVFKPNIRELQRATGIKIKNDSELLGIMRRVRQQIQARYLVVTRGEKGILVQSDDELIVIPSLKREVFDVTGAGDTVISIMVLALAAGLPIVESTLLSSIGAGIEVGKFGAATVSPEELLEIIQKDWENLLDSVERKEDLK